MSEEKVAVVFGGSLGIGEATAKVLKDDGARVTIVGRDADRLAAAATRIGGAATVVADALSRDAIARVFETTGSVDMVIICVAGSAKGIGPFLELDLDDVKAAFEQKTLAQLRIAQVAARQMRTKGSITFVTATSARSAIPGAVGPGAVNGAVEGTILSLAAELAPIRVNAVSPGLIDTPLWDFMPAAARSTFLSNIGAKLPVGRPGQASEVAEIIAAVARCGFVTGSIYEVDGGGRIASRSV
jgi:NAD(P)-dependent dehydrogenase (short-subunit alcohol dehydrogenase family)